MMRINRIPKSLKVKLENGYLFFYLCGEGIHLFRLQIYDFRFRSAGEIVRWKVGDFSIKLHTMRT